MDKELQLKLFEKYPKIFQDRNKSMQESCMYWGICTGNGWYNIIDSMCEAMTYTYSTGMKVGEEYVLVEPPQVVFAQLKEKFAMIRVYFHLEFDEQFQKLAYGENPNPEAKEIADRYRNYFDGIVHYAEVLSSRTCEETGKEGELHVSGGSRYGWLKTLNREFAKTDEFCVSRNYVPWSDISKEDEAPTPMEEQKQLVEEVKNQK